MYGDLVTAIARTVWAWRVELVLVADVVGLAVVVTAFMSPVVAAAILGALVAAAAGLARPRRLLRSVLAWSRVRRQWAVAVRAANLARLGQRVPVVLSARSVPAGDLLYIGLPAGTNSQDLESGAETLAASLGARAVRVTRDPGHGGRVHVLIARRDPLAGGRPVAWPNADAQQLSMWQPIPVGIAEGGEPVHVSLPERNVLLGGEPGAGKSAALSLLVATAALDPTCDVWLLDGKQVELATWTGVARHSVGPDLDEAIEVVRTLRAEMNARYAELLAHRARKVTRESGLPLQVVVCDELAYYLTTGDRRQRTDFADGMRDLVSRGRAAGVIVLAATQKPSSDIVPTSLRDLFGFRWALRCSTPQSSDTILGSGWASQGYSAADVDGAYRGIGYLLHEGGTPIRLRAHYLDDAALAALANRAEALRAAWSVATAETRQVGIR
jgi:hypothetical protein